MFDKIRNWMRSRNVHDSKEGENMSPQTMTSVPNLRGLLKSGPKAGKTSEIVLSAKLLEATGSAPAVSMPLLDDMRENISPRTPEEIARLIPLEREMQRAMRIQNDKLRWANQRAREI